MVVGGVKIERSAEIWQRHDMDPECKLHANVLIGLSLLVAAEVGGEEVEAMREKASTVLGKYMGLYAERHNPFDIVSMMATGDETAA